MKLHNITPHSAMKICLNNNKEDSIVGTLHFAGMKVLLVDQWIETGGTMKAAIQLVERLGATVAGQSRFHYLF